MVTTRNRSRNPSLRQVEMELPQPTRPRRARQTKPKPVIVQDAESETVESSSPTSSPESRSPPSEPEEPMSPVEVPKKSPLNVSVSSKKLEQYDEEEDEEEDGHEEEEAQAVPGDEQQSESAESEDESEEEDDDDNYEDLDALLVKAQASLKRKAIFEDKSNEPMFNFPKLQTGLKDKNVYIKQENGRAKVAVDNVVVVDKSSKAGNKAALETCEVNMNAEKVHVSKRQKQEEREKTTGKKWFDMPQQVLTPELRRDLQILRLRNVLDPKRFYKREEKGKPRFPKYFQVGTIIEGNTEFYSSRLSKKERATTITGEVMKDIAGRDYYKRKFDEIQVVKQSGGKRFNKKGKGKQSKSWRK
ncbi:hypothetical protein BGX30_006449 [Mortierella sp. GBA39]|nr:hypothetical protein BGX30_006449 [Mortierella sp. GBA39]